MIDQIEYEQPAAGDTASCCPCEFNGIDRNNISVIPYTEELRELLTSILSDEYMQAHTRFESFDAFRYSSAVIVNWERDVLIYRNDLFDNFVRESTEFASWDEMIEHAAAQAFSG